MLKIKGPEALRRPAKTYNLDIWSPVSFFLEKDAVARLLREFEARCRSFDKGNVPSFMSRNSSNKCNNRDVKLRTPIGHFYAHCAHERKRLCCTHGCTKISILYGACQIHAARYEAAEFKLFRGHRRYISAEGDVQ